MDVEELYRRSANGDRESKEELFTKLSVRFRVLIEHKVEDRAEREEIVQDTLLVIARKLETVPIHSSFVAWAHNVFHKEVLQYYKRKGYQRKLFGQVIDKMKSTDNPIDADLNRRLLECLKLLVSRNRRYARMINLHYQGYSVEEVCRKMDISSNNAYVILSRARSLLRTCMETGDLK